MVSFDDIRMGGSPGDVSEKSCDVGEAEERLENEQSSPSVQALHLRHSSLSNPSLALPTSQLILQPFCCFTYVTVHSPTLLLLLLRHRIFHLRHLASRPWIHVVTVRERPIWHENVLNSLLLNTFSVKLVHLSLVYRNISNLSWIYQYRDIIEVYPTLHMDAYIHIPVQAHDYFSESVKLDSKMLRVPYKVCTYSSSTMCTEHM